MLCIGGPGDYALVGANGDDDAATDAGAVYVFSRSGTVWTERQKLTASDPDTFDYFGRSICLNDDYALIGSRYVLAEALLFYLSALCP